DDQLVLLVRKRRALAGRADRDEPLGAFRDLPFDMISKRFLVQFAVLERCDQRRERSTELLLQPRRGSHDAILSRPDGPTPWETNGSGKGLKANVSNATDRRPGSRPHSRRFP